MQRKFELLMTDTSKAKLTVAVDRISLKLPKDIDEGMRDRMNRFACKVAEQIDYPVTVRGAITFSKRYQNLTTQLYTKSRHGKRVKEKIFTFNENEIMVDSVTE